MGRLPLAPDDVTRVCPRCKETKHRYADFSGPSAAYCKPCMAEYARERYQREKGKYAEYQATHAKAKAPKEGEGEEEEDEDQRGMTEEEFNQMLRDEIEAGKAAEAANPPAGNEDVDDEDEGDYRFRA